MKGETSKRLWNSDEEKKLLEMFLARCQKSRGELKLERF